MQRHGACDVSQSYTEAVKVGKSIGARAYVECSAKQCRGVANVFDAALRILTAPAPSKPKRHVCAIM